VGGEVEVYKGLDPNLWSFFKALSLAKELDTTAESVRLWWKPSNLLLDKNLKKLNDDVHALEMSEYVVKNHKGVDIYVEYNVTTDEGNDDFPNCIENVEVEAYGSAKDDDKGIAYDISDEENGSGIDSDSDYM
ncbi:hypothetical protein A2U01_0057509, partial [Trifolium medium]|nr:hypothetical protein [Trifolium medium]